MKCLEYTSSSHLSRESGYSPNAIRIKRLRTCWGCPDFSIKRSKKLVDIYVAAFNNWCSKDSTIKDISATAIQFILMYKFKELYGITITELSRFCDFAKLPYNQLVIKAPDGKIMINLLLYRQNLYNLLKFMEII